MKSMQKNNNKIHHLRYLGKKGEVLHPEAFERLLYGWQPNSESFYFYENAPTKHPLSGDIYSDMATIRMGQSSLPAVNFSGGVALEEELTSEELSAFKLIQKPMHINPTLNWDLLSEEVPDEVRFQPEVASALKLLKIKQHFHREIYIINSEESWLTKEYKAWCKKQENSNSKLLLICGIEDALYYCYDEIDIHLLTINYKNGEDIKINWYVVPEDKVLVKNNNNTNYNYFCFLKNDFPFFNDEIKQYQNLDNLLLDLHNVNYEFIYEELRKLQSSQRISLIHKLVELINSAKTVEELNKFTEILVTINNYVGRALEESMNFNFNKTAYVHFIMDKLCAINDVKEFAGKKIILNMMFADNAEFTEKVFQDYVRKYQYKESTSRMLEKFANKEEIQKKNNDLTEISNNNSLTSSDFKQIYTKSQSELKQLSTMDKDKEEEISQNTKQAKF